MGISAALITGASAGIGEVFARELARLGDRHLILVARRADRLELLRDQLLRVTAGKNLQMIMFQCDLRDRAEREKLLQSVDELGLEIDLLINNAGFGSLGSFLKSNLDWELEMVEVNCKAPLHLCHHFLPRMVAARRGAIINLCSTASYQPMPYMATYGSTKAFLLNFSLGLQAEVLAHGVQIQALCPGPTKSEFHLVVGLSDKLSHIPSMSAEQVVAESLAGLAHRAPVVINGWRNLFLAQCNRLLPRFTSARAVAWILRSYA